MHIDTRVFEDMSAPELRKYIDFLLRQYRLIDAYWFLNVEEQFGQPAAERINEKVWARLSGMAARDLKALLNIQGGLKALFQAYRLFPWSVLTSMDMEELGDEVIISVPHCPPQESRMKHGLGEFACKEMHRGEFTGFVREIDSRIRLECLFAPPDPHPKEMFCKWRFWIEERPAGTTS